MKVAIVGTRFDPDKHGIQLFQQVRQDVRSFVNALAEDTVVISGGAPGPDTWAANTAWALGRPQPVVIRPQWKDANGKVDLSAGFKRNTLIVEQADVVVAFWDGKSNGTRDTINKAHDANKLLAVFRYWNARD